MTGGTIIVLTSKNYPLPITGSRRKSSLVKTSYRFSRLSLSTFTTLRFADKVSIEEFPEGKENENARKKTEQNIACSAEGNLSARRRVDSF